MKMRLTEAWIQGGMHIAAGTVLELDEDQIVLLKKRGVIQDPKLPWPPLSKEVETNPVVIGLRKEVEKLTVELEAKDKEIAELTALLESKATAPSEEADGEAGDAEPTKKAAKK